MVRKLPISSFSAVKVATWIILLTFSNPAFCERRGIIFAFNMGWPSSGLILGYGLTDKLAIEAHLAANACPTASWGSTVGISMKYRLIPDNEKFYLSAGWSKIASGPRSPHFRSRTDDQGNKYATYVTEGYSAGLKFGLGREFSINQEKGLAENVFWAVEGGLYLALKDEQWRITRKDGENVMSVEKEDFFFRKAPFFYTGPIFYSKRE